jgi:hypothetical protein
MTNHIGLDELAIQEGIRKPWETLLMMTKTPYGLYAFAHKDLEHFAALVAAAEREACAELCEEHIGEDLYDMFGKHLAKQCAEAIRERGEQ